MAERYLYDIYDLKIGAVVEKSQRVSDLAKKYNVATGVINNSALTGRRINYRYVAKKAGAAWNEETKRLHEVMQEWDRTIYRGPGSEYEKRQKGGTRIEN